MSNDASEYFQGGNTPISDVWDEEELTKGINEEDGAINRINVAAEAMLKQQDIEADEDEKSRLRGCEGKLRLLLRPHEKKKRNLLIQKKKVQRRDDKAQRASPQSWYCDNNYKYNDAPFHYHQDDASMEDSYNEDAEGAFADQRIR